ncbi:MAG: deoxyribose-phosphate aldolase [Spirochaetes bacterium]|nr:deoxyribose-phosphate aldolase [Spirochaetota bacterium]
MIQQIQSNIIEKINYCFEILEKDKIKINFDQKEKIKKNIENYSIDKYFDYIKNGINPIIDHTYLKVDINYELVEKLIKEANEYGFAAVCIPPCFVPYARSIDKNIKIATVIGFPLGYNLDNIKFFETEEAIKNGADEIDMVINIPFLKEKRFYYTFNEIKEIKKICINKVLKVIIETCYLTFEEKIVASIISYLAGAEFIKTSTGFGTAGATLEDIVLMKMIYEDRGVKASGGIKTKEFAYELAKHGASRIGTSSSINIIK